MIISPEGRAQFRNYMQHLILRANIWDTWTWRWRLFFLLIKLPGMVIPWRYRQRWSHIWRGSLETFTLFRVCPTVCKLMYFTDNQLLTIHRQGIYRFHRCTTGVPFTLLSLSLSFSLQTFRWKKGSWWSASKNVPVKCCAVTYLILCSLIITCFQREESYWSSASSLPAVLHLQHSYHLTLQPSHTNTCAHTNIHTHTHTHTDFTLTLYLIDVALSIWVTYQYYPAKWLNGIHVKREIMTQYERSAVSVCA